MSSDVGTRRFHCEHCGSRCRCLPLRIIVTGVQLGAARHLMQELELCPSCKVAWLERHELLQRRPKPVHEARLWRYAEFTPADVEDLVEVQQWRRPARRGAGSGSNVD